MIFKSIFLKRKKSRIKRLKLYIILGSDLDRKMTYVVGDRPHNEMVPGKNFISETMRIKLWGLTC